MERPKRLLLIKKKHTTAFNRFSGESVVVVRVREGAQHRIHLVRDRQAKQPFRPTHVRRASGEPLRLRERPKEELPCSLLWFG